jgi:manganese/iron transport system permease protein
MRYVLLVLLALAVVTGIQAVGVVLTTALMITPAATASMVTRRLPWMFAWAVCIACLSSLIGLYASYYWSVSSGGAIVLACTALFGIVFTGQQLMAGSADNPNADGGPASTQSN